LWGANAVDGVINISTKSAKDTQGAYLSGGGGTEERGFTSARWGGALGERVYYRVWGKFCARDSFADPIDGGQRPDDWNMTRGGARIDAELDHGVSVMFQTEALYSDRLGEGTRLPVPGAHLTYETVNDDGNIRGGHALMRVSQDLDELGVWQLQSYYDRNDRTAFAGFGIDRQVADVDFRHHVRIGERNEFIWGAAYRFNRNAAPRRTSSMS
jgi:iron complex outermembrane receptor protein